MKVLGICKEVKNKWERRVPLNPKAVKNLVNQGIRVLVEPSKIRIYQDHEYIQAGAELSEDLSACDLILGVKEIPLDRIIDGKAHLFFSHTIKGQEYNMPLLKKFLDTKTTLIDYERIVDDKGKRLVFFGGFAGKAGMIEGLRGYGLRIKNAFGIENPFHKVKPAYQYPSFSEAMDHLREIGEEIKNKGLDERITPLNIFLLGYGNVSQGVQEVLSALPIKYVDPKDLDHQVSDRHSISLTIFKEEDLVIRKDGSEFNLMDYFNNGSLYRSKLEPFLPHCSIYVNAIYWAEGYPVFLPNQTLRDLHQKDQIKMQMLCDITCDIKGSIEATVKSTKPDNPCYVYDPGKDIIEDGIIGEGFPICAVDNLPCEFPRESSDSFSKVLEPMVAQILSSDVGDDLLGSELPNEIKRAVIAHNGELLPEYKYLYTNLKIKED